MSEPTTSTFPAHHVWRGIQEVLLADIGDQIDVDTVGTEDFDEEGSLTIVPPAARVLFMREDVPEEIENQAQNYMVEQHFAVLCAAEDRSSDNQAQRDKSLELAGRVKASLIGARIRLPDGSMSGPIVYTGMRPIPTTSVGMAYVPAFRVPGLAQFQAPNAIPPAYQGDSDD